ncbi:Tgs1 protein [Coprinopsis cinerea okayama7|uniref:Trimethylguanosine synthase n=1 Tax=Coprinopsis cinerea (strain Okayama-7 / 130 / ATCC MYA-4618 / FGSC 9003) TaxID=240176 RepID=A8N897_COPC7|nr:Tgs1 protein [Coprinopsis cinerea okayama7\|eukprot:XP_001831053.1 Tgs1 protein [Coprinopsis cinerea okayama7\
MGKNKRKGGLTGLARFVQESFKSDLPTPNSNQDSESPTKKRKFDETVVKKQYFATGLVPHYEYESQVPEHLQKYFSQRYRMFSLYSEPPGCLLDEEGWFSVTPERIANQIAERCRCDTILDAFCGVGGNAIAFAQTCNRVIALDTSPVRLALARHNAEIYGVADRIEFILADYISFANTLASSTPKSTSESNSSSTKQRIIDVVFLSPPWGGPSYLASVDTNGDAVETTEHPSYTLDSILPIPGTELFTLSRKLTPNIAYYLPRNTSIDEISKLAPNESIEVEEEWMGNKLKALTCYFGGLAAGQEELF